MVAPPRVRLLTIFSALVFSSSKVTSTLFAPGSSYFMTPGVLLRIVPILDLPPQVEHSGTVSRISRSAAHAKSLRPVVRQTTTVTIKKNLLACCIQSSFPGVSPLILIGISLKEVCGKNPEKYGRLPEPARNCRKMRILWIILTRCNMHFFNALGLTRREWI